MELSSQTPGTSHNPVHAALEALKSGQDVEAAAYGTPSKESTVASESEPVQEESEENSVDATSDEEAISEDSESAEDNQAETSEAIEEILVDAKTGKKVKVDLSDKEKIRRYVQLAHANFKWKADKDRAEARVKEIESQHSELSTTWNAFEDAWKTGGTPGIINLLEGDPQAYERYEKSVIAKYEKKQNATPAELKAIELEERLEEARKKQERLQEELDSRVNKAKQEQEEADSKALQTHLETSFSKYRLSGKLGDEAIEHQLDETIWEAAKANLAKLPEDTTLTPALIDAEFKRVASTFNKVIQRKTDEKVKKVVAKKKAAAQENVSAKALNGYKTTKDMDEFESKVMKGDILSAFRDVFVNKKVRL